jgi:hypothetical protein
MLLPSRGFHDGSDRCALRLPQHAKDGLLFGAAAAWTRNAVTLRRSFGANLAACRLGFYCVFCYATFAIPSIVAALGAVTTEAPRRQHGRRGEIPDRAERSVWLADTDALFAATVQSFLPLGRLFSL